VRYFTITNFNVVPVSYLLMDTLKELDVLWIPTRFMMRTGTVKVESDRRKVGRPTTFGT
jgi:hypothetical protein